MLIVLIVFVWLLFICKTILNKLKLSVLYYNEDDLEKVYLYDQFYLRDYKFYNKMYGARNLLF